jgi:hypothetical protein
MSNQHLRVLAVDWSGKIKDASESIWIAEATAGQITFLENGRSPGEVVEYLVDIASSGSQAVVGLDFAFSMPAWFVREKLATNGPEFWEIVSKSGEEWINKCPSPFFGHAGTKRPTRVDLLRQTELAAKGAKSVFQVAGAGAVGVGSIRGMPLLRSLRSGGWQIWPFEPAGRNVAVEIYPRLMTGPIRKGVWRNRISYLNENFSDLDQRFMERAAGSEDAFDAAVSALVMDGHRARFADLSRPVDSIELLEGRIWCPFPPKL